MGIKAKYSEKKEFDINITSSKDDNLDLVRISKNPDNKVPFRILDSDKNNCSINMTGCDGFGRFDGNIYTEKFILKEL